MVQLPVATTIIDSFVQFSMTSSCPGQLVALPFQTVLRKDNKLRSVKHMFIVVQDTYLRSF